MKISLLFLLSLASVSLSAQQALNNVWTSDNHVNALTYGDGKVFMAGDFSWFGEPYNSSVAVFNTSLAHDNTYPEIGGPVALSIPDDAGGWFITSRFKITHIKADKTIEDLPFDFGNSGNAIRGIAKLGNTLYVVGQFTSVNGTARGYGAAINLINNTLTSWDPNSGGYIYCVKAIGSVVYVGGSFSMVGGQTRSKIAAVDATTGAVTSWNANIAGGSGFVFVIEATASVVYFGGSFTNVASGSPSRRNFGAVNTTTGALTTFNPRPDDDVIALLLDGNTLYMAGDFEQAAGVPRSRVAAVDVTTGVATSFAVTLPRPFQKEIYAFAVDGNKLFVGGDFANINNTETGNLAVLNKFTGALEPAEDRAVSDYVLTLSMVDGKLLAGGNLRGISGVSNSYGLMALNGTTGKGTNWRPEFPDLGLNGYISNVKLHYQDNKVYYLAQVSRPADGFFGVLLGALNSSDGSAVSGWPVEIDTDVIEWAFSDDAIYLAGDFSEITGESRNLFAAVDLSSGELLPWTIPLEIFIGDGDDLYSIAYYDNAVYVTGDYFDSFSGEDRINFSAWNATSGELLDWYPDTNAGPIGAVHNGKIYLINDGLTRVDAETGDVDDWSPEISSDGVTTMLVNGTSVYYAGYFSPGLVRADINTGEVSGMQPVFYDVEDAEGSIRALAASSSQLYVGGAFLYPITSGEGRDLAIYPLTSTNSAPEIATVYQSIPVQGMIRIYLPDIITDVDDNVDYATLEILSGPESGAAAYLDSDYLIIDYSGLTFSGTDRATLRVCDTEEACTEQDITIELTSDIIVYNAISANGDLQNDRLRIANIETFSNNKVTIFNRWGDMVFEVTNYNNEDRVFKGNSTSGKELLSGVYYYKIEFTGGRKAQTGYLSLKR